MFAPRKTFTLSWNNQTLELGRRTCVMGILNVTPDSFSDGGQFYDTEAAVVHGEQMARDGADIIDIGGESTRPFAEAVPVEDEIRRVLPVIEGLAGRIAVPISIDTCKAEVARSALAAGASIINDVSALRGDPQLGSVAAESGVPVILMHMLGSPRTMQLSPSYDDLLGEIRSFLQDAIKRAEGLGVARSKLIADPGIGFGKTIDHNLSLIKHPEALSDLDVPILIGPSRKAFLRKLLKPEAVEDIRPDHPMVAVGTQAAVAAAVINGAHIVRVHDVAATRATVEILDAMAAAP
jgi:dihydropteroate synthase